MQNNIELIETKHPGKRKGVKIERDAYTAIASLMMHTIEFTQEITLAELITEAEKTITMHQNIAWLVYHVKLDLEAKGLVHLIPSRVKRNSFVLRLTSKAIRQKGKPFSYYQ